GQDAMRGSLASLAALTFILAAPAVARESSVTRARYAMGTVCTVTAADEKQVDAAFAEVRRVESLLSTWSDDGELARLNTLRESEVSEELLTLLRETVRWADKTRGAFNPLVGSLVRIWNLRGEGTVPAPVALRTAAAATRLENIEFDGRRVNLRNGAVVDEGGFGKGYAIDRALALVRGEAVVDFGGQIAVRGRTRVAVSDPSNRRRPILEFTLADASLSTSSGAENHFEADGKRFSHIVDPRTGQALPPRGSASAIAADAMTADLLSTALYVMGVEEGLRWANAHRVAAVFISGDRIHLSEHFREAIRDLTIVDEDFRLQEK
ncbi:MAG TPA: FAD:protein FMN transferase, partial [Thermoanaerobaculia bacterium]|nr:FAD:protein FMN transferase [Thermoanaerobaculia bacterium]